PMSRSRRWRWRRSRPRTSCGGSRPCSPSPPSRGRHSAAPRRPPPPPPRRGRGLPADPSGLDEECDWLVANDVLPADVVTRNRRVAEAALRPWTPEFTHRALRITHVSVSDDEVPGPTT